MRYNEFNLYGLVFSLQFSFHFTRFWFIIFRNLLLTLANFDSINWIENGAFWGQFKRVYDLCVYLKPMATDQSFEVNYACLGLRSFTKIKPNRWFWPRFIHKYAFSIWVNKKNRPENSVMNSTKLPSLFIYFQYFFPFIFFVPKERTPILKIFFPLVLFSCYFKISFLFISK